MSAQIWIAECGSDKVRVLDFPNTKEMRDMAFVMMEGGYLPVERVCNRVTLATPDNVEYREKVYENVADLIYEHGLAPLEALCFALSSRMGLCPSDGMVVAEWIYSRRISPQSWSNAICHAKEKVALATEH